METSKELRILMLEDNADDIVLIERTLRKSKFQFVARHVNDEKGFINELHSFEPHLVISDHSLPKFNSLEALTLIMNQKKRIPFIVFTGVLPDDFARACRQLGADGCLTKSNLSKLPQMIVQVVADRGMHPDFLPA